MSLLAPRRLDRVRWSLRRCRGVPGSLRGPDRPVASFALEVRRLPCRAQGRGRRAARRGKSHYRRRPAVFRGAVKMPPESPFSIPRRTASHASARAEARGSTARSALMDYGLVSSAALPAKRRAARATGSDAIAHRRRLRGIRAEATRGMSTRRCSNPPAIARRRGGMRTVGSRSRGVLVRREPCAGPQRRVTCAPRAQPADRRHSLSSSS